MFVVFNKKQPVSEDFASQFTKALPRDLIAKFSMYTIPTILGAMVRWIRENKMGESDEADKVWQRFLATIMVGGKILTQNMDTLYPQKPYYEPQHEEKVDVEE